MFVEGEAVDKEIKNRNKRTWRVKGGFGVVDSGWGVDERDCAG